MYHQYTIPSNQLMIKLLITNQAWINELHCKQNNSFIIGFNLRYIKNGETGPYNEKCCFDISLGRGHYMLSALFLALEMIWREKYKYWRYDKIQKYIWTDIEQVVQIINKTGRIGYLRLHAKTKQQNLTRPKRRVKISRDTHHRKTPTRLRK